MYYKFLLNKILSKSNFSKQIFNFTRRKFANKSNESGFLIYSNLGFDLKYPRIFAVIGSLSLLTSGYTSICIRRGYKENEPEVSSEINKIDTASAYKQYGSYFSFICFAGCAVLIFTLNNYFNRFVKQMFLSTDRQNIVIVVYQLFGKPKVMQLPAAEVRIQENKIFLKNSKKPLLTTPTGEYPNKTLFNSALGVYKSNKN